MDKVVRPQLGASAAKLSKIVATRLLEEAWVSLTPRQRVAHALAFGSRLDQEKPIADELLRKYSRGHLMKLAALADIDDPRRRKGGRPPKAHLDLGEAVAAAQRQAMNEGEHLSDWAACMRIASRHRKQFAGVTGPALYQRLRRAGRPDGLLRKPR